MNQHDELQATIDRLVLPGKGKLTRSSSQNARRRPTRDSESRG